MSKSSYLLIFISTFGNIPFNGAMASDTTISFYLESLDKINEKSYDGIINRLKKAGLYHSTDNDEECLKMKKSDLTGNDTSNTMSVKELTNKLCSKISKTYSWSGIWTIEIKIYKQIGGKLNPIKEKSTIDLGTDKLVIEFQEIKRNNTVAIVEILFIIALISVGPIYYYLYFFKKPVKKASSEQKVNK